MDELEKVINGLKCCIRSDREVFCSGRCPYYDDQSKCETKVKQDVYKYIGTKSQVVREVLFMRLSKLYDKPYSTIYNMGAGK